MDEATERPYEEQRLAALLSLRILDTPPEERFDRITRLVSAHFRVPIAAVNLIGADRLWSKANIGLGATEIPRWAALCATLAESGDSIVTADASADPRMRHNPLVVGAPHIRFYASVPLRSSSGYVIGALCIADTAPRPFSQAELGHLLDFAVWAEQELVSVQISEALLRQQEIEDALRVSEARYSAVIASLSEGVVYQDMDGSIVTWNKSAERILGLSPHQILAHNGIDPSWTTIREDGSPFPSAENPAMLALRTGEPQGPVMMGIVKPGGSQAWIAITSHPLVLPGSVRPAGVVSSFVDMTQHKQYEQQLTDYQHQLQIHNDALTVLATTDGLTNITNRRTLLERLAAELQIARHARTPVSLILLDVDHFKSYNDTFGHPAGDMVLKQVAQLLQGTARSTDVVARYGGEEFVLVLPSTPAEGGRHVAERLRAVIAQARFEYRAITASFGVATVVEGMSSPEELIARADAALYAAKRQGRNTVVFADSTEPLTIGL